MFFYASAPTSNGISLNDILQVGPSVQSDLFSIISRFRSNEVVFVSDIAKMYRQMQINESDYKYQRILWRFNANESIQEYQLLTLIYGFAPTAFLVTRTLNQFCKG